MKICSWLLSNSLMIVVLMNLIKRHKKLINQYGGLNEPEGQTVIPSSLLIMGPSENSRNVLVRIIERCKKVTDDGCLGCEIPGRVCTAVCGGLTCLIANSSAAQGTMAARLTPDLDTTPRSLNCGRRGKMRCPQPPPSRLEVFLEGRVTQDTER